MKTVIVLMSLVASVSFADDHMGKAKDMAHKAAKKTEEMAGKAHDATKKMADKAGAAVAPAVDCAKNPTDAACAAKH
jgi:hypothetical protein